ncbi:DUF4352 domain-containing protein [Actinoplanes sp. NBRC 101535]|uniref:DUF4352 domain-containing protein n=1 Tax=Actinoplanes sp. NBRC 101535 TaxID=3032196 RepID=UPI0024A0D055|nr:DUF4352 domain-containing protein [Actinoplanes sp. NBRC 101535]GLY02147.1 Mpr protein [Actinoplanes sp. NBRC 101535]
MTDQPLTPPAGQPGSAPGQPGFPTGQPGFPTGQPGVPGAPVAGYQLPPGYQFPPTPPRTKKKWPWIAGGAGALALIACCTGALTTGDTTDSVATGSDTPASASAPAKATTEPTKAVKAEATKKAAALPGIGDAVKDGKFQFTVKKVTCGKKSVGSSVLNQKAQGQFCLISVNVKNIGDESQMFAGSNQKAYDAEGTEFSNDSGAEIYANSEAETFLNEINPGNAVTGTLVFDVPKATKLTRLELHDSLFSGGVEVSLK